MMYTEKLITSLFTPAQLSELKQIYETANIEYLNDLQNDPFATNYTGQDLFSKVREFLNDVSFDESDAKELTSHLTYFFI